MNPPFFRNGFHVFSPFSNPIMKIAPSDQMRSNYPFSNGRASMEAQTVLILPCSPASLPTRDGVQERLVVVNGRYRAIRKTGKVAGLGSVPAADIEYFVPPGGREMRECFPCRSCTPGPLAGERFEYLVKKRWQVT